MNPMTNIKNTQKISDREIELGTAGTKNSWHNRYKDSAWIFIGGLPYDLTEGDVICVFSQCGEIVNCNMVRDQKTAKSKGFMFLCYEDQRSTILAVDNLNGIKILNRTIRVDHVLDYKPPKDHDNDHEMTKLLKSEGCAPKVESESEEDDVLELDPLQDMKHQKKKKKKEKKEKKHKKDSRSCSPSDDPRKRVKQEVVVKEEKVDPGYRDTDGYHGNKRRNERRHGDRYEGSDNETKSRRSDYEDGHRDQSDISHRDGNRDNRDGNRDNRDGNRDNRDGNPRDGNRAQRDGNPRDGHRNVRSRRSRERTPPVRRRSPSRRDRSRSRSRSPPRRDRSRSPPRRSRSRSPQRRGRSTDLRNKRR